MLKKSATSFLLVILMLNTHCSIIDTIIEPHQSAIESLQDQIVSNSPKPSAMSNFYRFLRILILLLANPTVQNNLKMINKLLISLVQTASQIAQNSATKGILLSHESAIESIDHTLIQEIIFELQLQTRGIILIKNRPTPADYDRQDKQEVQLILNSFAGVMQGFFTIVQDPENKENIMHGVADMLGNIIAAGKVIMKGSPIAMAHDEDAIAHWIDTIDETIKFSLLNQISNQRQCIRFVNQTDNHN